jgi:hypothetical protein
MGRDLGHWQAAVATISTGERRPPPLPPESAVTQAGRDTAGARSMQPSRNHGSVGWDERR